MDIPGHLVDLRDMNEKYIKYLYIYLLCNIVIVCREKDSRGDTAHNEKNMKNSINFIFLSRNVLFSI